MLVFLDDILIFSKTLAEHERHVRPVLDKLRAAKLYAKESKCEFFKTEVEFLGHIVGRDGVRMMEDKVQAVSDWPTPTKVGDVRAFLGTAGYYRKFIRDFSSHRRPADRAHQGRRQVRLGPRRSSWPSSKLKAATATRPCARRCPTPKLPFVVHTDASGFATGAVLQQDQGKGLQPIAFLSKKMLPAETRYPVHEQELLAIIHALESWRHYLSGRKFKRDDRSQVAAAFQDAAACCPAASRDGRTSSPTSTSTSSTSRARPTSWPTDSRDAPTISTAPSCSISAVFTAAATVPISSAPHPPQRGSPRCSADIHDAIAADPAYMAALNKRRTRSDPLQVQGGVILYHGSTACTSRTTSRLQTRILQECHDAPTGGHLGKDKTIEQVKRRFYWPGMDDDVAPVRDQLRCVPAQQAEPAGARWGR